MDLDTSIGLTCDSKDAEQYQLENAFPSTYRPTLRELLDAIAMQTKTHWGYNAKDQVAKSDKADEKEIAGIVNFVFEPAETSLGYGMTAPRLTGLHMIAQIGSCTYHRSLQWQWTYM